MTVSRLPDQGFVVIGLTTDTPSAAWIAALAVGAALVAFARDLGELAGRHPFVPKAATAAMARIASVTFAIFGVAVLIIGSLGLVASL